MIGLTPNGERIAAFCLAALCAAVLSGCNTLGSAEARAAEYATGFADEVCAMSDTDRAAVRARVDRLMGGHILRIECRDEQMEEEAP